MHEARAVTAGEFVHQHVDYWVTGGHFVSGKEPKPTGQSFNTV